MTFGQWGVFGVIAATLIGIASVWVAIRAQAQTHRAAVDATAQARQNELADTRADSYQAGAADRARELQPQLDLARYERDAAVRERDRALRELNDCQRRTETLEDEIRRIMRGGNGK